MVARETTTPTLTELMLKQGRLPGGVSTKEVEEWGFYRSAGSILILKKKMGMGGWGLKTQTCTGAEKVTEENKRGGQGVDNRAWWGLWQLGVF
jgi:hypothetical protein